MATIDISHRAPRNSLAVLPIFRQDSTSIPDYFIDQVMPTLTAASDIKVALAIFKLMKEAGEEEIITYRQQLADLTGLSKSAVNHSLTFFREQKIFQIIDDTSHNFGRKGRGELPTLSRIKFNNRVNYKKNGD
jgi:hypothetical protein